VFDPIDSRMLLFGAAGCSSACRCLAHHRLRLLCMVRRHTARQRVAYRLYITDTSNYLTAAIINCYWTVIGISIIIYFSRQHGRYTHTYSVGSENGVGGLCPCVLYSYTWQFLVPYDVRLQNVLITLPHQVGIRFFLYNLKRGHWLGAI